MPCCVAAGACGCIRRPGALSRTARSAQPDAGLRRFPGWLVDDLGRRVFHTQSNAFAQPAFRRRGRSAGADSDDQKKRSQEPQHGPARGIDFFGLHTIPFNQSSASCDRAIVLVPQCNRANKSCCAQYRLIVFHSSFLLDLQSTAMRRITKRANRHWRGLWVMFDALLRRTRQSPARSSARACRAADHGCHGRRADQRASLARKRSR